MSILWPPDAKNRFIGKDPEAGKYLRAGGEGGDRGWDDRMASLTRWTWIWPNSGRWWRTGQPGILQSTGSQRVGHNWTSEKEKNPQTLRMGAPRDSSPRAARIKSRETETRVQMSALGTFCLFVPGNWERKGYGDFPSHKELVSAY